MVTNKYISDNDRALFRQQVKKVRPLVKDNRIEPASLSSLSTSVPDHHDRTDRLGQDQSRTKARPVTVDATNGEFNGSSKPKPDHSRNQLMRRLRKGNIRITGELDLHGKTLLEAKAAVDRFLEKAIIDHMRCVLIISGKGYRSADGAVLQPALQCWLKDNNQVQGHCPALPLDGGSGAFYVLLRHG